MAIKNYTTKVDACPNTYGYEPENKPCPHEHVHQREVKEVLCAACWDRIVPGSEALHNE